MDKTMTQEEELELLCKDWEDICGNYKLERAAYVTMAKREGEEIQKLVDSIFKQLTDNMIDVLSQLSLSGDYCFDINLHAKDGRTFSNQLNISLRNLKEDQFIEGLFQKIWYTLGRGIVNGYITSIHETAKFAGYIKLTEVEARRSEVFTALQERADKRRKDSDRLNELSNNYDIWRRKVTSLMGEVGRAWYSSTEFHPGMKLVLRNCRTGKVSVKEIRSLSKKSANPLYRFTDNSYVPVDSDRILKLGTWFANNDYYRKIGTALDMDVAKVAN